MASGNAVDADLVHRLIEAVRNACIDAAMDGYEHASISGLCHEGAWEAAVSAIRMAALDAAVEQVVQADPERSAPVPVATESLQNVVLGLARRFASPSAPTAGGAAAVTGAIAAGFLESTAALSALRGTEGFRKRARSIASRGAVLQDSLSRAAQREAACVERWMEALREARGAARKEPATPAALAAATDSALDVAARCAQVTTLAAEVARHGHAAVQRDAAAALQLAASAAECALAVAEEHLGFAAESDWAQTTKRRIWRTRLLLHRGRSAPVTDARSRHLLRGPRG